jgi:hypothetical protein
MHRLQRRRAEPSAAEVRSRFAHLYVSLTTVFSGKRRRPAQEKSPSSEIPRDCTEENSILNGSLEQPGRNDGSESEIEMRPKCEYRESPKNLREFI